MIGKDKDEKVSSLKLTWNPFEYYIFLLILKLIKRPLSTEDGTKTKCWTLTDKQQFITARKDAVFIFEHDGLGPCYPFEGEKISVHWFRGKLVIAAKENQTTSLTRATTS